MAVDPATQFQQATLNIPYQFERSVYTPQAVNVPSEAGALWSKVGETAMKAANMLMNSPMNPAVREELQARYKSAQEGINQFNTLDKAGVGPLMYWTDEQGRAHALAPGQVQDKTMATQLLSRLGIGPKIGTGGGEEKKLPPEPGTGTGDEEKKTEEQPKEAKPKPPTAEEAGKGQALVAPTDTDTSNLAASTDNDFLIRKMMAERQAAGLGGSSAAPEGTPSSLTFLNPATGNIEPRMFTAPTAAPPPAAPSQPVQATQQETQPTTPGTVPGSLSDQYAKQQLAQWQLQNAHPVMSSSDALNWAKLYDTGAQRATYLQHGGPGGEPAYAFHMKGGGINTVPISQIVKNGGAAPVAGQNTSAALSASDALMNQPPGQAPGMTLGATDQPPPGMNLGQQGQTPPGPPPAPAPPPQAPITDIYGNPLSAYTSVASQGGQTRDQFFAQTAGAGQAAEPPLGARITPPPPPLPNNNVISQEDQAKVQAAADAMPPLDPNKPYAGDREVEFKGSPYHWRIDDNPLSGSYKGRVYTAEPPDPGNLFNPRRWYLGDEGYRSVELPASEMRNEMKYWIKRGDLKPEEVLTMPEDEMKTWLKRKWEFENLRMQDPDRGTADTLNGGAEYVKAMAQVRDNLNALKALGENPDSLGKFLNTLGGAAQSLRIPVGDPYVTKAYENLEQSVNHADLIANNYKNLLLQQGKGGGAGVNIPLWLLGGRVSTDIKADVPESSRLGDVFSGRSVGSKLMDIDSIYNDATQKYDNMVQDSHGQWLRISPKHDVNVDKLDANKQLDDKYNLYVGGRVPIAQDDFKDFSQKHPDVNVRVRMNDGTYRNVWTPKSIGQRMGRAQ